MSYFRITLIRSAIGLPEKSTNVLKALGLRKRMATVFHPVSPAVAGQIMKVKELLAVREVDKPLTKQEVHAERVPDSGFYIESTATDNLPNSGTPEQESLGADRLRGSKKPANFRTKYLRILSQKTNASMIGFWRMDPSRASSNRLSPEWSPVLNNYGRRGRISAHFHQSPGGVLHPS